MYYLMAFCVIVFTFAAGLASAFLLYIVHIGDYEPVAYIVWTFAPIILLLFAVIASHVQEGHR